MVRFVFLTIGVLGVIGFLAVAFWRTWRRIRGARVITCPETSAPAGVELDAIYAALTGWGPPKLRLKECSRWPERQNCGQECLSQIEAAPQDCLVRNILTSWYSNKVCVFCRKPVGDIDWFQHKPALWSPDRKSLEWHEVAAEAIPYVLKTHLPICWNCHIAATFRREYPELVTDRPATKLRITEIH
jgi:hypothetical protein